MAHLTRLLAVHPTKPSGDLPTSPRLTTLHHPDTTKFAYLVLLAKHAEASEWIVTAARAAPFHAAVTAMCMPASALAGYMHAD